MTSVDKTVAFGARQVSPEEKARLVNQVFTSVASRYDLMNDLMSLGSHRLLKRMLVEMAGLRPGHRVLDLAGGTGDVAGLIAPRVGTAGRVVLADFNPAMLTRGRSRLLDSGHANVSCCVAAAEALPFAPASFHCVTLAFGLRNFASREAALRELQRVLKPSGTLLILEFSKPRNALLETGYRVFQRLWPLLGRAVVGDASSYRYLVESIETHPDQAGIAKLMSEAGFRNIEYHNLIGGIVAIHRASA